MLKVEKSDVEKNLTFFHVENRKIINIFFNIPKP